MLSSYINNSMILFNFQSGSIVNETLSKNIELLHTTDDNGKAFQKALAEFQEEVIINCRSGRELDIVFLFLPNF